jgi:hypothetical protein
MLPNMTEDIRSTSVDAEKKAINTAENIMHTIQFWRKPDTIAKRLIRKKIKTNYNTCKMLFNGFFEKVRESSRNDYFDDDSMTMSKLVVNPDMDIVKNAITTFSEYGFMLSIYKVSKVLDEPTYRVVMSPGKLITTFFSENVVSNGNFDAYTFYQRMNIEMR